MSFISSNARGLYYRILHVSARAGRERKFPQAWRAMVVQREYKGFTRAEPGYGQFREPGGAVPRGGVCKTGEAPARVPRKARREGRSRRLHPKGGRRVPRRGGMIRPRGAEPARGKQLFPRKLSRGTRPARPAGGGTNAFCFPSMGEPAPPGIGTSCTKHRILRFFTSAFPDSFARLNDSFVPAPRGCCSIVFQKTIRARPLSGRTPFSRARVPRISDSGCTSPAPPP